MTAEFWRIHVRIEFIRQVNSHDADSDDKNAIVGKTIARMSLLATNF